MLCAALGLALAVAFFMSGTDMRGTLTRLAPSEDAADPIETQPASEGPRADAPATDTALPEAAPPEELAGRLEVDLLRVETDGSGILSGRAAPGSEIAIALDGVTLATGLADGTGVFATLLSLPPMSAPGRLTLSQRRDDGTVLESAQSFVIDLPSGIDPRSAPAGREEGETLAAATSEIAEPPPAPALEPAASQSVAPRVLRMEPDGLSVVQDGGGGLSIDTITYDDAGGVTLGGRGLKEEPVQVWLDGRKLDRATVDTDGQWRLALPELPERVYTLRVEQLDAQGRVTDQTETPFRPEDPETLAEVAALSPGEEMGRVTVQPGYTLWAIAERRYGDGLNYVKVFEANAKAIRNPDLIYPGQIFTFPVD